MVWNALLFWGTDFLGESALWLIGSSGYRCYRRFAFLDFRFGDRSDTACRVPTIGGVG